MFSKGGFVGVPVVFAAKSRHIPVILHESDYSCGLANRICMRHARTVCVSFEPTLRCLKGQHGVWTGLPIRHEIVSGKKERAQAFCRFEDPDRPWILIMGGSLGSLAINSAIKDAFLDLCRLYNVVHLRGKGHLDPSLSHPNYRQYEFLRDEMADVYAASSLAVCRSGANTLFELLALHKPAVFIPLPLSQSRGDQITNAQYFQSLGYADVLMEENLNPNSLLHAIAQALVHASAMKKAMARSPVVDGTAAVLREIYKAVGV